MFWGAPQSVEDRKPKTWLKTVVAFANTNGGRLVFGIDDTTRDVIGIDSPQAALSKISELLSSRITPIPRYTIQETYTKSASRPCIEVRVENGPNYPYYYVHEGTKEIYVRHGDRSEIAREYEASNLILKGQHRIGRILGSYAGCSAKPEFQSDADYFFVMLPNRSMDAQRSTISENESGKVDVSMENVDVSDDRELKYFADNILSSAGHRFRAKRREQILELFSKYRYEYIFGRSTIVQQFGIVDNTASVIVNKMVALDLIEKVSRGRYRFKKR